MKINLISPAYYISPTEPVAPRATASASPLAPPQTAAQTALESSASNPAGIIAYVGPAAVVEISPEGRAAYEASAAALSAEKTSGSGECQTCANRRYVDSSDDPSVSFQTPTRLSPREAVSAVPAHEAEHVKNEQAKADSNERVVVSQSVSIQTSICPECGKSYVSGGETRTVTAPRASRASGKQNTQIIQNNNQSNQSNQNRVVSSGIYGSRHSVSASGRVLDLVA
ncbi:MAG: hypothetical protein FWH55_14150 [Oscillospiraceae bacterium]|nr:hypothetical protein [Oscillospiraceae bacterium]